MAAQTPVCVEPDQPAHAVQTAHQHIHLHVIAIVEPMCGHLVNMMGVESKEPQCYTNLWQDFREVNKDPEEEDQQGEEHRGEGAEVVHHFSEGSVPGVEDCGPDPGVDRHHSVHRPHTVHWRSLRYKFPEPGNHVQMAQQVQQRKQH